MNTQCIGASRLDLCVRKKIHYFFSDLWGTTVIGWNRQSDKKAWVEGTGRGRLRIWIWNQIWST